LAWFSRLVAHDVLGGQARQRKVDVHFVEPRGNSAPHPWQCGFSALLAKLEEITDAPGESDVHQPS